MSETMVMDAKKIVVWHESEEVRDAVIAAVQSLGYESVSRPFTSDEIVEAVVDDETIALIVCDMQVGSNNAVDCLLRIAEERAVPAVVVTNKDSLASVEQALEDHVMAYLIEPVCKSEIRPTLYLVLKRFEEFVELREQVEDLKETMVVRKNIERAKGVIMRRNDVDENEAHQRLRRIAMDSRSKLSEAAQKVLEDEQSTNPPRR